MNSIKVLLAILLIAFAMGGCAYHQAEPILPKPEPLLSSYLDGEWISEDGEDQLVYFKVWNADLRLDVDATFQGNGFTMVFWENQILEEDATVGVLQGMYTFLGTSNSDEPKLLVNGIVNYTVEKVEGRLRMSFQVPLYGPVVLFKKE